MSKSWKKISSKVVYKTPWMSIREDKVIRPDGTKGIYSIVDVKRSVTILAIEGKDIYLTKEYRYTTGKDMLSVCTGGNSKHEKDSALKLAKTELLEELGFRAKKWKLLGIYYPFKGLSNEKCYVYLAQDLIKVGNNLEEEEFLSVQKMSIKKFGKLVESGQMKDGFSIVGYYKLKEYLNL